MSHFSSFLITIICFLKSTISQKADLYISYNETNFKCEEKEIFACGDLLKPFTSILQAFYYIDLNSQNLMANFSEINLFLISEYYIIDEGNATYYLSKLNDLNSRSMVYWTVFEGLFGIGINIIPVNSSTSIIIAIKTLLVSFSLNDIYFRIENLIFNGGDLQLHYFEIPECYYWKIGCCLEESNQITEPDMDCGFPEISYFSPVQNNVFVINGFNPVFKISFCSFLNLNLVKVYRSFYMNAFLIDKSLTADIMIENSIFSNIQVKSFLFGNYQIQSIHGFSGKFLCYNNTITKLQNQNHIFEFYFLYQITIKNSKFEEVNRLIFLYLNLLFIFENNLMKEHNNGFYSNGDLINSNSLKILFFNNTFEGIYNNLQIFSLGGSLITIQKIVLNLIYLANSCFAFSSTWSKIWIEDLVLNILELEKSEQIIFNLNSIQILTIFNSKINNINDKMCVILYGTVQKFDIKYSLLSAIRGGFSWNFKENNFAFMHNVYFNNTLIEFADESNIKVSNCWFIQENITNKNLFLMKSNCFMYLYNCLFEKITALKVGSIFNLRNDNYLIIKNSTYFSIKSFEGGSILFADTSNKIKFINCSLSNL